MTACPVRGHDHDLTVMWTVQRECDGHLLSRLSCPKGYRFLRVNDNEPMRIARPRWGYPAWAEEVPDRDGLTVVVARG